MLQLVVLALVVSFGLAAAPAAAQVNVQSTKVDREWGLLGAVKGPDGTLYVPASNKHRSLDTAPSLFAFNPDGSLKWHRVFGRRLTVNARVAVSKNNDVYIALNPIPREGGHDPSLLVALNERGETQWSVEMDPWYRITARVVVAESGLIYVSAFSRKGDDRHPSAFIAFQPNGFEKWRFSFRDENLTPSNIQVGPEKGYVYITADNPLDNARKPSRLIVFKETDFLPQVTEVKVSRRLQLTAPVGAPDGSQIVVANHRYMGSPGGIFCFEKDGAVRWYRELDAMYYARNHVSIAKDGTIYVPLTVRRVNDHDEPIILALNPDGSEKWRFRYGSWNIITSSMGIGSDGVVYAGVTNLVGGTDHRSSLLAVKPDGTLAWRRGLERYLEPSGPIPGDKGIVYMAVDNPGVQNPSSPAQFLRYEALHDEFLQ